VIYFPAALPGFPEEKRFLLIEQPVNHPLVFLQSVSSPELCFVTAPVRGIDPGYELAMGVEDLGLVELPADRPPRIGEDVVCLAILAFSEDGPPTANLLSPVVINLKRGLAVQAIQPDSGHSHRQPLVEPTLEEAACS